MVQTINSMKFFLSSIFLVPLVSFSQPDRWQQHVKYAIEVNVDAKSNIIKGNQTITYTNNSPDTLSRIFLHLYWNGFKPNSMMDVSSRSTEKLVLGLDRNGNPVYDFDRRFRKKIYEMTPEEQGSCNVIKFNYDGR